MMRVLVAYESRGGRTRRAAEAIAAAARNEGHTVALKPLAQVGRDDVLESEMLFLGTWVQGYILFGVGPANAALRWLGDLPPLGGKPVAVFCTYAFNPRGTLALLRTSLETKSAKVVGERSFNHRQPELGADGFARGALAAVASREP
jgi:flavodoxin